MNRHSVSMYSQNHPSEASVPLIARSIRQFGHTQLHLTGHVRKGNPDLSFSELVNKIRHAADIPKLDYTFS